MCARDERMRAEATLVALAQARSDAKDWVKSEQGAFEAVVMKEQEEAQIACARLQGELTACQAEHASQLHAGGLEAGAQLRSFEIEAERRQEAFGMQLKNAEAIHSHIVGIPRTHRQSRGGPCRYHRNVL